MSVFLELVVDLVLSFIPDVLFARWERRNGWVAIGTVDRDHAHALRARLLRRRIATRLHERGDGRVELLTPTHHRDAVLAEIEYLGIMSH